MRRGTLIFIVFVLVAGAIVGVSQYLRSQPPVEYVVAVNPLAADWLREAVAGFNATNPVVAATQRVHFNVTSIEDLAVWQGGENWTADHHPAAWIPASAVSVAYTERYVLAADSVAQTLLVWGGYESRVAVATDNGALPLDWPAVQAAAQAESWSSIGGQSGWRFVKLAFAPPDQSMSGLAALFSAAASFSGDVDIGAGATRSPEFRDWLRPVVESVPNFQTLGADPAGAMARGPSTAELALLPENRWLLNLNGLLNHEPVVFSYPADQFVLDFPLAQWRDPLPDQDTERAAVAALADWLLRPEQQARLQAYGLRPASGAPDATAALFTAAERYGIQPAPDLARLVQPPPRSETQGLIQWFVNTRR
jgi:hypothetical protein